MTIKLSDYDKVDISPLTTECHIAMEAIDFQRDDYFIPALTTLVSKIELTIAGGVYKGTQIDEIHEEMSILVMDRFGLNVTFAINENKFPYSVPKNLGNTQRSIFDIFKKKTPLDKIKVEEFDGFIDVKTVKASGCFSGYQNDIYYNPRTVFTSEDSETSGLLSSQEVTALLTREVGNIFSYFEYVYRSANICKRTIGISKDTNEKNTKKEKTKLALEKSKEIGLLTEKDEIEINDVSLKENDMSFLMIKKMTKNVAINVPKQFFEDEFEDTIADSFTARLGAGRALTKAYYKIHKLYKIKITISPIYILYSLMVFMSTIVFIIALVNMMTGLLLFALASFLMGSFTIASVNVVILILVFMLFASLLGSKTIKSKANNVNIDNIHDRFENMKKDIIMTLKDNDLSKEEKKLLLLDLENLDLITKLVSNKIKPIKSIMDFFSGKKADDEYHKLLDSLTANALIVQSTKLDLLT